MKSPIGPIALTLSAMLLLAMASLLPLSSTLAAEEAPMEKSTPMVAMTEQADSCRAVLAKLDEQDRKISGELRRIKRDIAALNQGIAEPGLRDAAAGIGYILGIFGIAAFMASRRTNRTAGK